MDKRRALIENMKKLIRERRAGIDPAILARAQDAALKSQATKRKQEEGTVPYDRASALQAIDLFLQNHPDSRGLRARLRTLFSGKDE